MAEEAEAIAEKNRREGRPDFIDKSKVEETLRQERAADEPDIPEARCELQVQKLFEIAGIEFDALS